MVVHIPDLSWQSFPPFLRAYEKGEIYEKLSHFRGFSTLPSFLIFNLNFLSF